LSIYSSASNSAKGSTEVDPATVIPALDFWQPIVVERITRSKKNPNFKLPNPK
jgi:hypothetical protein